MDNPFKDFCYKGEWEIEERYYSMYRYTYAINDPVDRRKTDDSRDRERP